jgi:hypothetical protein
LSVSFTPLGPEPAPARDPERAAALLGRHTLVTSEFYAGVLSDSKQPAQPVGHITGR